MRTSKTNDSRGRQMNTVIRDQAVVVEQRSAATAAAPNACAGRYIISAEGEMDGTGGAADLTVTATLVSEKDREEDLTVSVMATLVSEVDREEMYSLTISDEEDVELLSAMHNMVAVVKEEMVSVRA